jgi:hypothetical protein
MRRPGLGGALLCALVVFAEANAWAALPLQLELGGYWRMQSLAVWNTYDLDHVPGGTAPTEALTYAAYLMQRLRLEPRLSLEKIATFRIQADVFDDVVWGDNEQQTFGVPLFAEQPSNMNFLGQSVPSIQVKRAWLELNLPIGVLRAGRQPSNWGLGILSNAGDGFDDDLGENHFGSTFDRIAFATKPLTIYRTLTHATDTESSLIVAYAYDKLSEEPCLTDRPPWSSRGFDCTVLNPVDRFTKFFDERPYGSTGWLEHGGNDVQEHIIVVYYNNEKWHPWRPTDQLKVGTYIVFRTQDQSYTLPRPAGVPDHGAFAGIYDGYYKLRLGPWYSEAEAYVILGHASGVLPLGCPGAACDKDAQIIGLAWRAGWLTEKLDLVFEFGYASGDDSLGDATFKQRPLHPDYNVGLLMYEEVMRQRSFAVYSPFAGNALQSLGGVIDSFYLYPRLRYRPARLPGLEGVFALVAAWRDQADELLFSAARSRFMGLELDGALKYAWADQHLSFALSGGLLFFGGAFEYRSDAAGTLQTRLALLF